MTPAMDDAVEGCGGADDMLAALEEMGRGSDSEDDYGPPATRVVEAHDDDAPSGSMGGGGTAATHTPASGASQPPPPPRGDEADCTMSSGEADPPLAGAVVAALRELDATRLPASIDECAQDVVCGGGGHSHAVSSASFVSCGVAAVSTAGHAACAAVGWAVGRWTMPRPGPGAQSTGGSPAGWMASAAAAGGRRSLSRIHGTCAVACAAGFAVWYGGLPFVRRAVVADLKSAVGAYLEGVIRFVVLNGAVVQQARAARRAVVEHEMTATLGGLGGGPRGGARSPAQGGRQGYQLTVLRAVYSGVAALQPAGSGVVVNDMDQSTLYNTSSAGAGGSARSTHIAFDSLPPRQPVVEIMNLVAFAEMRCQQLTADAANTAARLGVRGFLDRGYAVRGSTAELWGATGAMRAAADELEQCNRTLDTARMRLQVAQSWEAVGGWAKEPVVGKHTPVAVSDMQLAALARQRCKGLLLDAAAAVMAGDAGWEGGRKLMAEALREWDALHKPVVYGDDGSSSDGEGCEVASQATSSTAESAVRGAAAADAWDGVLPPTEVLTTTGALADPREEYRHYPAPSLQAPPVPESVRAKGRARGEVTRDLPLPTPEEAAQAEEAKAAASAFNPLLLDLQGELRAALGLQKKAT